MRIGAFVRAQEGVAAVTTILFAIVLFGSAAMVMDAGGVLMLERQMVTAADAAALSAAARCAEDRTDQYTKALETARANVPAADPVGAVSCNTSNKTVAVTYRTSRDLSFAPLLGFDTSVVTTEATAMWGAALQAVPLPLVLGAESSPCVSATSPAVGTSCTLWFFSGVDDSPGNWGFVDLSSINNVAKCGGGTRTITDEIMDNETMYELNESGGTPVCRSTGDPPRLWSTLATQIGQVRAFPVIDGTITGKKVFSIIGYAPLRIDQVWDARKNLAEALAACGPLPVPSNAASCVVASFQGGVANPGPLRTGSDFGVRSIRLKS